MGASFHDVIELLCGSGDSFMFAFLLSLLSCCRRDRRFRTRDAVDLPDLPAQRHNVRIAVNISWTMARCAFLLVCLAVRCQLASRLSLRICLSKARAGTMRRSVLTRPAVGPAV